MLYSQLSFFLYLQSLIDVRYNLLHLHELLKSFILCADNELSLISFEYFINYVNLFCFPVDKNYFYFHFHVKKRE